MSSTTDPQVLARTAEDIYTKATKAELSSNYDQAFKLYIQATESFLHLSRSTNQEKDKWKGNAQKALERAEKIKAFVQRKKDGGMERNNTGAAGEEGSTVRLTPVGINYFSLQEQYYILKRGSRINGLTFPLWNDSPPPLPTTSQFNDPDGQPQLSSEQQRVSSIWFRPIAESFNTKRTINPQEILQHIVTDCSVCASISVCLEHSKRFGSNLAKSSLHNSNGIPISLDNRDRQNGRYDVKMFINGGWRRSLHLLTNSSGTVIDNLLPYNPQDGSLMCMTIRSSKRDDEKQTIYWPSLIEKSYMKLMGGYDFPGSNSSIDLHTIIGWIPEQIDTKFPTFEREKTWERLISGFTDGKCLVTLGTGPKPGIHWRGIPLLSAHSYAVIDIDENETDRIFTVLDSWVRPEDEQCSRILHIPWSEVVYVFDGIYLSWDPEMWKRHIDFHGMWKRGGDENEVDANHNLRLNFINANSETEEDLWILLTRHLRTTTTTITQQPNNANNRNDDFICLRAQIENPALPPAATIINQQQQHETAGTYTNSTHFLVRTRIPSTYRSGTVFVTASYEGVKEAKEIGFSVSVYSGMNLQIAWDESVTPPPYSTRVEGTFTSKNSGGNCSYPTFMVNPQYHLRVHPSTTPGIGDAGTGGAKKSMTKVVLKGVKDVPVNVVVTWSKGDRKDELIEQEVAATSGAYTYGLAQIIKNLTPGDYTLIISTFEPYHTGPYTLRLECSTPFDLKTISQEGAGMYAKVVKGIWDVDNAMGGPQFHRYSLNPKFELMLPTSGQIKIRLQLDKNNKVNSTAALNVALFNSITNVPVATSGVYSETLAGVVTPLVTLSKGKYTIVPSTHTPGIQVEFKLIVYTSMSGVEVKRIR